MKPKPDKVVVRVPASTSNCGAGFDTLGLALSLYNRITLCREASAGAVPERPEDGRAQVMVEEAAAAFSRALGKPCTGFRYRIEGDVPPARGLGSSVTVIAGIIAGLDALHCSRLPKGRLVGLVSDVEGHPDNASAGVLGGFTVSRSDPVTGAYVDTQRFKVPSTVAFVVASPEVELLTKESRGALPSVLPFFDGVRSLNGAAYFVAAFAKQDFESLGNAEGDFIHEPYRLPNIPGGSASIRSGIEAGAWTGWLSGSGSSVLCMCEQSKSRAVLDAMTKAFAKVSMACEGRILAADNDGLVVEI